MDGIDGNVAILAPRSPEVDKQDLALLMRDGAVGDSSVFRGIFKFTEIGANLSPAEDVDADGAKSLECLHNVGS